MSETQQNETTGSRTPLLTFLIADVRGYTRFTNEHGDEAAARLADRFAQFCEEILGAHEGKVIELRGDEALAVFPSARSALRGAVALQQAFKQSIHDDPSLPLNVGMGLDAGEAIPVRGGYRGGALNLATRLCSIAGAGEILASEGVIHVARKTEGLVFVDRGQVTLKGLADPVRVLQIAPDGEAPENPPPLQPILATHPTNLPDEPTPFIGREGEIAAITGLLRDPHIRLVTLTGPGGTGKTRLALQVGNTLLYDFQDGVFFCDLAPLTDPALVPTTIASVLGVKEEGGRPLMDVLIEQLRGKHILLVLDNFEHLIEAGSAVASLLDACRELHVLVTSRVPLHLSRENEHGIPPLAVPDLSQSYDLASLTQYESVALFIQRARAARDSFAVTDENAPAVAEICARLDGLPLAIELAAARIKLFPPQALLQRLDSRMKLLTGGARDKPTRQQTLRGAIDWSYDLLNEDEQTLFARLSVFAGGWSFEAAEAVGNEDGMLEILDGMASLVDKSLIRQEGEEEPRFSMLETIREYAAEKLRERGEDEGIRAAHAVYYLDQAPREDQEDLSSWVARTDHEVDNLRAAFRWSVVHDPARAQRSALAVGPYWDHHGVYSEAAAWLQDAVECGPQEPVNRRAELLSDLADCWRMLGDVERSFHTAEEAVRLARESEDPSAMAHALAVFARLCVFRDDMDTARRTLEEILPIARDSGKQDILVLVLAMRGSIAVKDGDLDMAQAYLEEAWSCGPRAAEDPGVAWMLSGLALLRGDADQARVIAEQGIAAAAEMGNTWFVQGHTAEMLARALIQQHDLDAARIQLQRSLAAVLEKGSKLCVAHALEGFARLSLAENRRARAIRLLAASFAVQESLGMKVLPIERLLLDQTVESACRAVEGPVYAREWAEGAAMSRNAAVAYAQAQ